MRLSHNDTAASTFGGIDIADTELLSLDEERSLLRELSECKRALADCLPKQQRGHDDESGDADSVTKQIANYYSGLAQEGPQRARLGATFLRYKEIRERLALANMRLVAHVAKRFRDRGIAQSDLIQEGLCGLLEAIDRFDFRHGTKLATYATWWIRQAIQGLVAGTAYPVRLSPRHLRQLAQNQGGLAQRGARGETVPDEAAASRDDVSPELVQRIHAATRPTISLDATIDHESQFSLLQNMSDPDADVCSDVDRDETVAKLMAGLRPREQQVLELRFGLGGRPRMSLSQVGRALDVSKERVRQIQERALGKLRACVGEPQSARLAL